MIRCVIDESLQRTLIEGFRFALGVYPVEDMVPKQGYAVEFEPSDGGDQGGDDDLEQWPDRYAYDVVLSHERLDPFIDACFALLPGRVFPILDFLGHDAFREVDPYIAYERCGVERLIDGYRRFRPFMLEDGMVGFGAMSEEPFFYFFVDEHKIVTLRCEPEGRRPIERLLEAFDLEEIAEPAGADAAAHEHRNVLTAPDNEPSVLSGEEIVEHLRDRWRLSLNIDPESNVDDEGHELGLTAWRCLVRCIADADPEPRTRYGEALLWAQCLREAEDLASEAFDAAPPGSSAVAEDDAWLDVQVVAADRVGKERLAELTQTAKAAGRIVARRPRGDGPGVVLARWLEA